MSDILLECGHRANAIKTNEDGSITQCCVICAPDIKAYTPVKKQPNLKGRTAICSGCKHVPKAKAESSLKLPFFNYRPTEETDTYYCGCWGWN